jgi:hypothetical protein
MKRKQAPGDHVAIQAALDDPDNAEHATALRWAIEKATRGFEIDTDNAFHPYALAYERLGFMSFLELGNPKRILECVPAALQAFLENYPVEIPRAPDFLPRVRRALLWRVSFVMMNTARCPKGQHYAFRFAERAIGNWPVADRDEFRAAVHRTPVRVVWSMLMHNPLVPKAAIDEFRSELTRWYKRHQVLRVLTAVGQVQPDTKSRRGV